MKKIIQIFCIIFLFFMTVNLNLTELNTVNEKSINSISKNYKIIIFILIINMIINNIRKI